MQPTIQRAIHPYACKASAAPSLPPHGTRRRAHVITDPTRFPPNSDPKNRPLTAIKILDSPKQKSRRQGLRLIPTRNLSVLNYAPVPVNFTDCGLPGSLVVIVKVPVR